VSIVAFPVEPSVSRWHSLPLYIAACVLVLAGPTMGRAQRADTSAMTWRDLSPHHVGFVGPKDRRLQYLDWGGAGPPLVLLHGWNSDAHVFDDMAPRLVGPFHVVAFSLPGFGNSDAPDSAYSLNTAADAVLSALDSLHIPQASFAGHSFAGWILSRIATRYPARVNRLIYLDAAFDLRRSDSIVALRPLQRPSTSGLHTQGDVMGWLRKNFYGMWSPALEAEYRGRSTEEAQRAPLLKSIVADAQGSPEEWPKIRSPVLGICAIATMSSEFPWLAASDSLFSTARSYVELVRRPFQHDECARFQRTVPHARTLELEGHHYVFVAHRDAVIAAIRDFLLRDSSGK
jgi:pimeloyl-ACP methyl ester carboxylesterase